MFVTETISITLECPLDRFNLFLVSNSSFGTSDDSSATPFSPICLGLLLSGLCGLSKLQICSILSGIS